MSKSPACMYASAHVKSPLRLLGRLVHLPLPPKPGTSSRSASVKMISRRNVKVILGATRLLDGLT